MDLKTHDRYSYSTPEQVCVKHIDLDLIVSFDNRTLKGVVVLKLDRAFAGDLILDTRSLTIERVEYSSAGNDFQETDFAMGDVNPVLGAELQINLPGPATVVRITYRTSPDASGLQWLEPIQTSARKYPLLFTQSQATHARSWVPLQDTPAVRMTYTATIREPLGLGVLMGVPDNPSVFRMPKARFDMRHPIPSYLLALAIGDFEFRPTGPRSGVFAEKPVIERAAHEFEDLESMLATAERLFGPYRWGRYDLLVLPPSFPVGGMENPCLTFITPTIIAGDKSLISVIVHELAHSWSSNLVSNATWRDFWINEGFTVYMERRILEELYGPERAETQGVLALQQLREELARSDPEDQILERKNDRDPNIGLSQIPYEKGALFLTTLEKTFGRERFDPFLRSFLHKFAFQSITTSQFVDYLQTNLLAQDPNKAVKVRVDEWLHAPGLPKGASLPKSAALARIEEQASHWINGRIPTSALEASDWSTQEWLYFLRNLSGKIDASRMEELDQEFHLTGSDNAELQNQWLLMAIETGYAPAYKRLEHFLETVGRRKYLRPLYEELVKTPDGRKRALKVYRRVRLTYHPITQAAISEIFDQNSD